MRRFVIRMLPLLLPLALLFLWEWLVAYRELSELILPAPSTILRSLWQGLTSGYLLPHVGVTLTEIALGLLLGGLCGFAAGVAMGESSLLRRLLSPYVIASQAVPKLALTPLFAIWFGFGMTSKVVITALICFFPILESTLSIVHYADRSRLELFRSLGAGRLTVLLRCKLPGGLTELMSGIRVAVVLAVVGAVVGEFIGASRGLGALIIASQGMMDTPLMFAVLLLLTLIGLALYYAVSLIERMLLRHRYPAGGSAKR
ncbi:ABC transporter permease [Paenibacillus sp. 1P07SE]|uniref:ABC transporter permease n=1 Tax=Paenibacillus sp. 1P07SE TaxID=3132209 RepID=UPI0039A4ECB7